MRGFPDEIRKHLEARVPDKGPVPLPTQIFKNALNFHESAQRCFENRAQEDGRSSFPIIPGIVGLAFACELYFKALHVMGTGKAKAERQHRLNVLFAGLPEATRSSLSECYGRRRRGLNLDLSADLLTFANAFVEYRYVYEGKAGEMDIVGLAQLASSLYEVIVQLRPELRADAYTHGRMTAAMQGVPLFGGVAPRQPGPTSG